ncbi:MAG TPA: methyltransferase domain-containing protein [Terriglobales bacterium]|nr:methyltransferase domain-containing protein [Terriglobales bacterium]
MKILVAIANYGTRNDRYLSQVLDQFRRLPHQVQLVVTSNLAKNIAADVEVIPGLPTKDPWSLPFAHKRVFADRLDFHDLFVYTEDDVLIGAQNISGFLRASEILAENELPGFLRSEIDSQGRVYFPDVHSHFHWDAGSVTRRGDHVFAHFTNLHSACYALTQSQLRRAIRSGGFLVPPHQGDYDTLVTAATDPYTQCGFRKLLCISHVEEFIVSHLPNRYVGQPLRGGELSLCAEDFHAQLRALLSLSKNGKPKATLFPVETNVRYRRWSKSYYESCQEEAIALLPEGAKSVLSIGCGWGATEARLVERGIKVKALPIDPVIAASAQSRGIEIIFADAQAACRQLAGERFDCLLILNVLHLVRDPVRFLASFLPFCPEGSVIASVPNVSKLRRLFRRIQFRSRDANPQNYQTHGMHVTNRSVIQRWLRQAGLRPVKTGYQVSDKHKAADRRSLGLARGTLAETCSILAYRA